MRVSDVLSFGAYYDDARFQKKKPVLGRTWREACGDNIYHRDERGRWIQDPSPYHNTPEQLVQDTKHPRVFTSGHFYYFGEHAIELPNEFSGLIWRRQGCRCSSPEEIVEAFAHWLETTFEPGLHGEPRDGEGGC